MEMVAGNSSMQNYACKLTKSKVCKLKVAANEDGCRELVEVHVYYQLKQGTLFVISS